MLQQRHFNGQDSAIAATTEGVQLANLQAALGAASNGEEVWRLLSAAPAAEVEAGAVLEALHRMAGLRLDSGAPPTPGELEAFAAARTLLFDRLRQEGRPPSGLECSQVLAASAALGLPPTPEQQAVLEAALAQDGPRRGRLERILSAYVQLGLQPGPELSAAIPLLSGLEPGSQVGGYRARAEAAWRAFDLAAELEAPGSGAPCLAKKNYQHVFALLLHVPGCLPRLPAAG